MEKNAWWGVLIILAVFALIIRILQAIFGYGGTYIAIIVGGAILLTVGNMVVSHNEKEEGKRKKAEEEDEKSRLAAELKIKREREHQEKNQKYQETRERFLQYIAEIRRIIIMMEDPSMDKARTTMALDNSLSKLVGDHDIDKIFINEKENLNEIKTIKANLAKKFGEESILVERIDRIMEQDDE